MSALKGLFGRHMPVFVSGSIAVVCGAAGIVTLKAGAFALASFFASLLVLALAYLFGFFLLAAAPALKTLRSLW